MKRAMAPTLPMVALEVAAEEMKVVAVATAAARSSSRAPPRAPRAATS